MSIQKPAACINQTSQAIKGPLATRPGPIYKQKGNIWIGWPGMQIADGHGQKTIIKTLAKNSLNMHSMTRLVHYHVNKRWLTSMTARTIL